MIVNFLREISLIQIDGKAPSKIGKQLFTYLWMLYIKIKREYTSTSYYKNSSKEMIYDNAKKITS